jgi:hypothetical protein
MSSPDPAGQVSLILCESILHLLVEEGVIPKAKALEAINGVVELVRKIDQTDKHPAANRSATSHIEAIAQSFALKD